MTLTAIGDRADSTVNDKPSSSQGDSLGRLLGVTSFLVVFLYSAWAGDSFTKLPTLPLILVELVLLGFCEFGPLSDFAARKLCHSFSGLLMLHLDPADPISRLFVYSVAVSSLLMVWQIGVTFKFRYSNTRDVGISVYLVLMVVFFYHQIPLEIIKPVFFADPLGALVGRHLTQAGCWNPAWIGQKTVGGSLAVFLATLLTLSFGSSGEKLLLSALVTVAEGLSREYDNLLIAGLVILGYRVL